MNEFKSHAAENKVCIKAFWWNTITCGGYDLPSSLNKKIIISQSDGKIFIYSNIDINKYDLHIVYTYNDVSRSTIAQLYVLLY